MDAHCKQLKLPVASRLSRAGGWLLATAHIVTAIIGAGVLGLPYALSWLGQYNWRMSDRLPNSMVLQQVYKSADI